MPLLCNLGLENPSRIRCSLSFSTSDLILFPFPSFKCYNWIVSLPIWIAAHNTRLFFKETCLHPSAPLHCWIKILIFRSFRHLVTSACFLVYPRGVSHNSRITGDNKTLRSKYASSVLLWVLLDMSYSQLITLLLFTQLFTQLWLERFLDFTDAYVLNPMPLVLRSISHKIWIDTRWNLFI